MNVCIISPLVKVIVSYLFPVALIVCLVTTLNEKRLRKLGQVINNSISMGDQVDITNIDQDSPTIIDTLNKLDKRNK